MGRWRPEAGHGTAPVMARKSSKAPAAGGILIALGSIIGAVVGLYAGEPTKGLLIGFGAGAGMAIAIWLLDLRQ